MILIQTLKGLANWKDSGYLQDLTKKELSMHLFYKSRQSFRIKVEYFSKKLRPESLIQQKLKANLELP